MARHISRETTARQEGKTKSRYSPISLGPTLTQSDTNSPFLGLVTGQTATYLDVGKI